MNLCSNKVLSSVGAICFCIIKSVSYFGLFGVGLGLSLLSWALCRALGFSHHQHALPENEKDKSVHAPSIIPRGKAPGFYRHKDVFTDPPGNSLDLTMCLAQTTKPGIQQRALVKAGSGITPALPTQHGKDQNHSHKQSLGTSYTWEQGCSMIPPREEPEGCDNNTQTSTDDRKTLSSYDNQHRSIEGLESAKLFYTNIGSNYSSRRSSLCDAEDPELLALSYDSLDSDLDRTLRPTEFSSPVSPISDNISETSDKFDDTFGKETDPIPIISRQTVDCNALHSYASDSSAMFKRRLYSASKSNSLSPSLEFSLKGWSRSSSLFSINTSFDIEEIMSDIDSQNGFNQLVYVDDELPAVNDELRDIEESLNKLKTADYCQPYSQPESLLKLFDLVSDSKLILSNEELSTAIYVIQNQVYTERHGDVNRLKYRTVSSHDLAQIDRDLSNNDSRQIRWIQSCQDMRRYMTPEFSDSGFVTEQKPVCSRASFSLAFEETDEGSLVADDSGVSSRLCYTLKKSDIIEHMLTVSEGALSEAYRCIYREHGYNQLVEVRGENVCPLATVLCSILLNDVDFLDHLTPFTFLIQSLPEFLSRHKQIFSGMDCMLPGEYNSKLAQSFESFYSQMKAINSFPSKTEKETELIKFLNCFSEEVISFSHIIRLLMLHKAWDSKPHSLTCCDRPPSVFHSHMSSKYKRMLQQETSQESLLLDDVEMDFLGHMMGVTFIVFRPLHYNKESFIAYNPCCITKQQGASLIPLLADDNRHLYGLLQC